MDDELPEAVSGVIGRQDGVRDLHEVLQAGALTL